MKPSSHFAQNYSMLSSTTLSCSSTPRGTQMGDSARDPYRLRRDLLISSDVEPNENDMPILVPIHRRARSTTTIRSTSRGIEDGKTPIIQTVLECNRQEGHSEVQTLATQPRTRMVYPDPIPDMPTCSTSFSRKCWLSWRSTPGPGAFPGAQQYKAIGTENHAQYFDVPPGIKRTSEAVHEKLEVLRRRPTFYSYETRKKYDAPCYLMNPNGKRKPNHDFGGMPGRDPRRTLAEVRSSSNMRFRDILRQSRVDLMGVSF